MPELTRILLAEDSAKDVELTLEAFEESHLVNRVDVVRDGAEALDYLHGQAKFEPNGPRHPMVVLLDMKLPKVGRLEVLARMKADPVLKSIPVVIMTSSREERDMVEGYKLGVNAYLVKPVEFTLLPTR